MALIISVRLFNHPFTVCYITDNAFMLPNEEAYVSVGVKVGNSNSIVEKGGEKSWKKKWKFRSSALFLQPFVKECMISDVYRRSVLKNLKRVAGCPQNGVVFLKLKLEPPDQELIDYSWNEKILRLIWTRVEIENAFSWLSTLGGAYSALGDYFEYCADEAGRISVRQYRLSQMLGDDSLAARSRLYSALAYAQKGNLKLARHIVRNVAAFARSTHDKRLNRMCQGVWAKLKYLRRMQHENSICKEFGDSSMV